MSLLSLSGDFGHLLYSPNQNLDVCKKKKTGLITAYLVHAECNFHAFLSTLLSTHFSFLSLTGGMEVAAIIHPTMKLSLCSKSRTQWWGIVICVHVPNLKYGSFTFGYFPALISFTLLVHANETLLGENI